LIQEGETVFLGSGSTVLQLAQELRAYHHLTVITNSLAVVNALSAAQGVTLVSLGGIFRPSELSFIGHITEQALAEVHADHVFIGIRAIDSAHGLTNDHLPETMTDRAILQAGRTVVVLADHTKLGRVSTAFVAPANAVHVLVTGRDAPAAFIQSVTDLGIQVIIAD
jgi:DeoR/GlpR family transcriptional regulator of sugar metabolism